MAKIAVLTSGGVDSSVALALLKAAGHDLTAFYLKIWLEDELSFLGSCPWEEDLEFVTKLCEQLEVPLEVLPFQRTYHDRIMSYTLAEIKAGRTPNPDILCNEQIKFGAFFEAIDSSFEKVATGHYARVREVGSLPAACPEELQSSVSKDARVRETPHGFELLRAADPVKDQTYFLARLSQAQVARACFPIGHLKKSEVRELAREHNLPAKERDESQGLCFLGSINFTEFVRANLGEQPGNLIEFETGAVVGTHKGFWFYTTGQRQGLGLSGGPWYVVGKRPATNEVLISRNYFSPEKVRNSFGVAGAHWISGVAPTKEDLAVKIRHGEACYNCRLVLAGDAGTVTLDGRDQGLAPGQFAVFYDGEVCLGCAVIAEPGG